MGALGNKRKCMKCGAKYYDLGNAAFPCPTCGQLALAPVRESRPDMDDGPRALVRRPNELRPHQDQIIDHFIVRGRDSQARVGTLREAIIHAVQRSETVRDALEVRVHAPGFGSHKITMSDIHHCLDNEYILLKTTESEARPSPMGTETARLSGHPFPTLAAPQAHAALASAMPPADAPDERCPEWEEAEPVLDPPNAPMAAESTLHPLQHPNEDNCMSTLNIPASLVKQGSLSLFVTSIRVRDLMRPGFYSVETLDPDKKDDKGYQRLLNTARAKKVADYVVKGQDSQEAFLPTSIFLATDKTFDFDPETNSISFDIRQVGPFSVVDGQHRLEGLRIAAEKDHRVHDFQIPVNIAVGLSKISQMCHFLIVNTTQKSVDKAVEQRIIARLSEAIELEDIPMLPKWILNVVEKGEVEKAIKMVDYLNDVEGSPWYGKIKMANNNATAGSVNQGTFVKAIVKYVLTANNPITAIMDSEKERKIFLNYWKAIADCLDDGNAAVLYKYNGVELFCKFSIPFFMKLQDRGSFTVESMKTLLQASFDNMEGEYAGLGHPDWWASGSAASFLNAGALNVITNHLTKALHITKGSQLIEL